MVDIYKHMNTQNILKFYDSKLRVRLDHSEFYDMDLAPSGNDYNSGVLDFNTPITYPELIINTNLSGFSCVRETITLEEIDNRADDDNYVYSGLTFTLPYENFVNHIGENYVHTILNNDVYLFLGFSGEAHLFKVVSFNDPIPTIYDPQTIIEGFFSEVGLSCVEKIQSLENCCSQPLALSNKPWAYEFKSDDCDEIIPQREEKGWTLDFVFNKESLPWASGGVFYYVGVRGDDDPMNYSDNNLSFQFTEDGRVKWVVNHYTGVCVNDVEYTHQFYVETDETIPLPLFDETKDFNLTIVFDRYLRYTDCDIPNEGGVNDLVVDMSKPDVEELNEKWQREKYKRLGTLKIYLNGRPIYIKKDWEEVIPSNRGVQPFIQSWGGGTGLMDNIHDGVCCFNMKHIGYYRRPLSFVYVYHNYRYKSKTFDFYKHVVNCGQPIRYIKQT